MTIENGRFIGDTKEEILSILIAGAEEAFGREFTPDEVSVVRSFYGPVAEYLALQQTDIREVMDSTQIENAGGTALDMLTALIGVYRLESNPATVLQQFQRDSRAQKSYTIPSGAGVQTDESDPLIFETTEKTSIQYLDGFEDGNLNEYSGDVASFDVLNTSDANEGDRFLYLNDTGDNRIYREDKVVAHGSRIHVDMRNAQDGIMGFIFGLQDTNNYYQVKFHHGATDDVLVEENNGGGLNTLGSSSMSLPKGEWLEFQIDWHYGGGFAITVFKNDGTEIGSFTVSESEQSWTSGGWGFSDVATSATKWWDYVSMSRTTVTAEATTSGTETNVGKDTLNIFRSILTGVDSTTNISAGTGGRDEEPDEEFRARAIEELSEGTSATLPAIIKAVSSVEEVQDLAVFVNDSASTDGDNRPSHSFEVVADVPVDAEEKVARAILDSKAAGDIDTSGHVGTSVTKTLDLVNGQTKDIEFSKPTEVQIYVDCDITKTNTYGGDDEVQDNIVQYIGGALNSGNNISGDISVGDDVIYNQIIDAVMNVEGVHDITNLEVGASSIPTGTSNVSIATTEAAVADATDSSIDVTSSDA